MNEESKKILNTKPNCVIKLKGKLGEFSSDNEAILEILEENAKTIVKSKKEEEKNGNL